VFTPGETITHAFIIPFAANELNKVVVSYKQQESIVFEKTITYGFIAKDQHITSIEFQLTQEESLLFADDEEITIQLNVYTNQGTRHSSRELSSSSYVQYLREIMQPDSMQIIVQPVDWTVTSIGQEATFSIGAVGVAKYQWQISVDEAEFTDISDARSSTYTTLATQEAIAHNKYRCAIMDVAGSTIYSNPAGFVMVGGDE